MIKNRNIINVPFKYRHWIDPETRKKAFYEIVKGYERYGLKCIYAFLNQDPRDLIDYCIIYKGRNDDDTHDIILLDVMALNGYRCTPYYEYYKMIGETDKFFQMGAEEMSLMTPETFYRYLNNRIHLSRDKKSPRYWKLPEHSGVLVEELLEASMRFTRDMVNQG